MAMPYVQSIFNSALKKLDPDPPSREIIVLLGKFPSIAVAQQQALLDLLRQCLAKLSYRNIELVGCLFDCLAPQKSSHSLSSMSNSLSQETSSSSISSIPSTIFGSAPEFWGVYIEFKEAIDKFIDEDPSLLRSHLKFLTRFPQILGSSTSWACSTRTCRSG